METQLPFGKDFVANLIPQKFPFVMVDKLYSYAEDALVSGLQIQNDNIFTITGT